MYKEIKREKVAEFEAEVRKYWDDINLLKLTETTREGKPEFVWYEGPPTANGRPGIHHMISRALKDAPLKYRTMKGYHVVRKAGWDTHGLPVELEVEKVLGFNGKNQIEEYGIEEFNKRCRESVFKYESAWRDLTEKMGFLIDLDNAYFTLNNDYIETEWWILDKVFKEGLMYEGHKILPYCSRCGTGLASHEVALGYKEIKSQTVICKFKATDEDAYYLAWTTTPWTLAGNVALAVNPDETYVKIKSNGEIYYLAEALLNEVIQDEYEVLSKLKGKDLEYREYEQLMPFVKPDKKAFYIVNADYVTIGDGTGIVHTAPAFGEDDYNIALKYNLPVLQPVDESGLYTSTPWIGKSVLEEKVTIEILIWLSENQKLFSKQKVSHNYPHCWRCDTPLLYYAKPGWYIKMTAVKDKLVENNNTVKWFPSYVGEKRFGNWLENVNDWAISRSRYWGTPLNIWRCEKCGEITTVQSRKELVERAIENIDETIELHRPYIDDVHLTCSKCQGKMSRVSDVIDCWFDSGSMPFAQHHYPFENKDIFEKRFPANYIVEGVDQTRGWFYSLLAVSTLVTGKAPYKEVLVNDLILDKDGKKMSKSKGNTVDPFKLMDELGADALRWYMHYVSPAWLPTKFDVEALREISSKFFGTLKNVYTFFTLYANEDGLDVSEFNIPLSERPEIDKWIISKLNKLVKYVDEQFQVYDMTKITRTIYEFVVEDLSNWYIRRNRRRFWASELSDDKKAVYQTTMECLVTLSKLIAPLTPYMSEEMYRNLTGEKSVHLADYPVAKDSFISEYVEERMDLVRNIVKLGRAARENVRIKIRQPLKKIYVSGEHKNLISDLVDLIKEELNVKEVVFEENLSQYMNFVLKPNFRLLGPVLGKKMNLFTKELSSLDQNLWASKIKSGEKLVLELDGEKMSFDAEMIEVGINAKEGLTVEMENNLFAILDTEITEDLLLEGFAREFISRVQMTRKQIGLEMADRISIEYNSTDLVKKAVVSHLDYIKKETLCDLLENKENLNGETVKLNDEDAIINVSKLS